MGDVLQLRKMAKTPYVIIDIGNTHDEPTKVQYRAMRDAIAALEDEVYDQTIKQNGIANSYAITVSHELMQKFRIAMNDANWRDE